jgi:hypothetical protein
MKSSKSIINTSIPKKSKSTTKKKIKKKSK